MSFDFYDFSKYRAQLMGIAMLLIMLFHVGALSYGYVGVEFFLLLSAIGLYFSLSKNDQLGPFYKKRLVRILPTYLIVAIPYFIYVRRDNFDMGEFFMNLTGVGILQHENSYWFIIHIIICYLLSPFYFKVLKYKYSVIIPFAVAAFCYWLGTHIPELEIMLNRFAIFLLGFHVAKLVFNRTQIRHPMLLPVCLVAILLIPVVQELPMNGGLKMVAFFFLTLPSLMLLIKILKLCPAAVNKSLVFIGGITLEIYMFHEHFCFALLEKPFGHLTGAILSFPISILVSYLFSKMIQRLSSRLLSA